MKTKIISVITAICLLLSVMTMFASAAGEKGMISIDSVSAKVGEKVTVPVKMEQNPGLLAIVFSVTYDNNVLTFDSINYSGKLFSKDEIDVNSDLTGEVVLSLMTSSLTKDVTGTGEIVGIVFTVNKNATNGTYPITANVTSSGNMSGQAVNASEQLVDFDFINGTITVTGGKDAPKTTVAAKTEAAAQQNATVESIVSYVQTEADGQPVTDEKGESVTATSKVYVPAGEVAGDNSAEGDNNNPDAQLSNVPDLANDANSNNANGSKGSGLGTGAIIAIILLAVAIILCVVAVIITKKRNAAAVTGGADNENKVENIADTADTQNAPEAQPTENSGEDATDSEDKE
ncbi:MAG: cohesin domain-containing protein [Acutalibacteraceae bacterium]